MRKVILIFGLFYCSVIQGNNLPDSFNLKIGSVTGTVIDNLLQQPVAYAAIVIKTADGSETITGGISTENGAFDIKNLPEGNLLFQVQFIGYKTYSQLITISKNNIKVDIGIIVLEEETQELTGVVVVAERTTIEQKIDRKVINIGRDLTTTGATAADIMNNIASVNVDQQTGDLTLRGNSNVRVMVDGKLSNVPVAQLLKQIPSTSIKSIELITNPSAKYNPDGMSGIINIILHKNSNIGFNGTINMGLKVADEAKFNSSINLNYKVGKFNFYGSYGNNIGKYLTDGLISREAENSDQIIDFFINNKSHLYKLGVDLFLNEKNTISLFTNQNKYDGIFNGRTGILYYDAPIRNSTQLFSNVKDHLSEQYNFDYKLVFDNEAHNLELEVDYNKFSGDENTDFRQTGNSVFPNYKDFVETNRTQTIANLDYVNPLDSITKLEAGMEVRLFETKIDYSSTGLSYSPSGTLSPTPNVDFNYGMDIYSAYATFSQNYEKWSYQAGVRVEDVKVSVDTSAVRTFTDSYTQLYPSAFLTYSPTEKNKFQLSYSKRVDRPGLQQVNPIREWSTPLISSIGNPNLTPQFTNSYELNYIRRFNNGSITTTAYYRAIKNEINRAMYVDRLDLNKLIITFDNLDDTSAYGIEISGNYKPTQWWSINSSFDLYSQTQRGIVESLGVNNVPATPEDIIIEEVAVENTTWNFRINNSFKASNKLSFQLFGNYMGKNQNIQFLVEPRYAVNTGARYSFAQGKGTLSLTFNDIFNTMRYAFGSNRPYVQNAQFKWESRTVFGGFSYMFGSGKNKAVQRKKRDNNTKEGGGML